MLKYYKHGKSRKVMSFAAFISFWYSFLHAFVSEQQWNTPNTCQCYYGVNNTAEQCTGTAENPRNKVKAEKTYKPPVNTTDYCENQANFIKHSFHLFAVFIMLVWVCFLKNIPVFKKWGLFLLEDCIRSIVPDFWKDDKSAVRY